MKPISPTTLPSVKLKPSNGSVSMVYKAPTNKIGWVHTKTEKPGISFDFVLRDALGREMLRKENCTTETERFGQFMNIDARMGEEIEVSLENIKGVSEEEEIEVYLN